MKTEPEAKTCDRWEIEVVKSLDEVEAVHGIWKQMHRSESMPALNSDIDRYLTFIESMKESVRPHVIILYCNGSPKAMVIGRIENQKITCRLGYKKILDPSLKCLTVVYGGALGQFSNDVSTLLLKELIDSLKRREANVVFLNHLRIDSHLYHLATKMPNFWCKDHFSVVESHWQTHIPESIKDFYETIPSKHKREWRRCERKLAEKCNGSVRVVCYRDEKDVDYLMETSCQISSITYKHALNVGIVDDELTRSLLNQAARDGCLRAYILYVNDVPCAFEFGVCFGEVYFPEYMGYDPKWTTFGPGALLWVKVIEDLCTDPTIDTLDYGFGDAAYKERFGTKSWPEASVYIFAPRFYPIIINLLRGSVMSLNVCLQYVLQKIGFLEWVKRQWRNLLQGKNADSECEVGS